MTTQAYTRTVEQPTASVLSGSVYDFGIEFVSRFNDPSQALTSSSAHVAQTRLIPIAPIADYSMATGTSISGTPTIHDSAVGGQIINLTNFSTNGAFYSIQSESLVSGTMLKLNYPCRTLAPEMSMELMLWGLFGQSNYWREIGNMDDAPQGGITAFSGGGQANAVALKHKRNLVSATSTGASVKMPLPLAYGMPVFISNMASTQINLFPVSNSSLGAIAVNSSLAIPAGKTAQVWPSSSGRYDYILST